MSLTSALNHAFSGLTANARAASVVSNNISNALTDGYGRREVGLASSRLGGVTVTGVTRVQDPVLIADRRLSDAGMGSSRAWQLYANKLEFAVGESGDPGSLAARLLAFENALLTAAGNPASSQRLQSVLQTADAFARMLNTLSDTVQTARVSADRNIANDVKTLNANLARLEDLNGQIQKASIRNSDVTSLLDERQRALDAISEIVPLRVVERAHQTVSVFTLGGAQLLDPGAASFQFQPKSVVTPGQSQGAGQLAGLVMNGMPVDTTQNGMFAGGSLAAHFEIRDEAAPELQAQLDGIARDLIERLGPGGPDGTVLPGQPGFFTDTGLAFDPVNEVGISARLSVNAALDPAKGGDLWRIRDGIGAPSPGEVGNAQLLQAISASLTDLRTPSSGTIGTQARGFEQHIAAFASDVAGARVRADAEQAFQSGRQVALREMELASGVDTDMELQSLMQIEQNYAANARMMSVVDDLMAQLLNI